jgi:hypothetical protein
MLAEIDEVAGDFMAGFEIEDQGLVYYDAPLLGWMRSKQTGERFAFNCLCILPGMLWHWVLVPAGDEADAETALSTVDAERCPEWLSVIEDRRSGVVRSSAVRIRSAQLQPLVGT